MLNHDEKRDFIRMDVDCDVSFKLTGSDLVYGGRGLTLSGAGVSFIADQAYDIGLALEVSIHPKTPLTPPMTAFVEVVRCAPYESEDESETETAKFEIGAVIKSIKGN